MKKLLLILAILISFFAHAQTPVAPKSIGNPQIFSDLQGGSTLYFLKTPPSSWLVLSNVFNKTTHVASNGDSMSAGTWEPFLQTNLGSNYTVTSNGVPGATTADMRSRQPQINNANYSYIVVLGGINDVAHISAVAIEANLQAIYTSAHTTGGKVIALTMLPFGSSALWTSGRQACADSVNTWILNTATNLDYKIDMRPVMWNPVNHLNLNPTYASADNLHPNSLGYSVMANTISSNVTFTSAVTNPTLSLSKNVTIDQDLRSDQPVAWPTITTNQIIVNSQKYASFPMPNTSTATLPFFSVNRGAMAFDTTNNVIRTGDGSHHRFLWSADSTGVTQIPTGAFFKIAAIYEPTSTNNFFVTWGTNGGSVGSNVADSRTILTVHELNAGWTGNYLSGNIGVNASVFNIDYTGKGFFSNLNDAGLTASSLVGTDGSKNLATITALPSGTTATTQAANDNSTKVATTAYVNGAGYFTLPALTSGSVLFSNGTTISQDNSNFFYNSTNHQLGLGTVAPTGAITVGSTLNSAGFDLYNTVDQTTNFERFRILFSSNSLLLQTAKGGTGAQRNIIVDGAATLIRASGATVMTAQGQGVIGSAQFAFGQSGSSNTSVVGITSTMALSANTNYGLSIIPTINQTSTASSALLWISPFVQAAGSGTQDLIKVGTNSAANGSGTDSPVLEVNSNGHIVMNETNNKFVGQTTLSSGTKAISITGVTSSSRAFVQLVSIGGTVTTTWHYAAVCSTNTLTITALTTSNTTNASDTSIVNYWVVN